MRGESVKEWLIVGSVFGILIVISFMLGWVIGVKMTAKKAAETLEQKLKEIGIPIKVETRS